ncbi:MAG: alpha-ketoglutarate-dependent dioxygenase AlkB, partial [Flavobacteriaceae bacterium]|nr:alpha-ketoglutarate-dependent dioxygenase AlkB [Flavobacteriaceae bacterium]
ALYGNKSYSYSNITMHPIPFTETLLEIKSKVEEIVEQEFNVCLLNLYRNGNDSNGWHSDNEQSLGKNPTIASISLGATRKFNLKHNDLKDEKLSFDLTHNSLFVMRGETQHFWKHQIPKTKKKVSERINLTFRIIK